MGRNRRNRNNNQNNNHNNNRNNNNNNQRNNNNNNNNNNRNNNQNQNGNNGGQKGGNQNQHYRKTGMAEFLCQLFSQGRLNSQALRDLVAMLALCIELSLSMLLRKGMTEAEIAREWALPLKACSIINQATGWMMEGVASGVLPPDADGDIPMIGSEDWRWPDAVGTNLAADPDLVLMDFLKRWIMDGNGGCNGCCPRS